MGVLEALVTSPVGRRVAGRVGLAEPPVLRRGREPVPGPVVLATLDGGGIGA